MKRINISGIILALLILSSTFINNEAVAQRTVTKTNYDQGVMFCVSFPDVDSTKTYYSEYFDWSMIDGYADGSLGSTALVKWPMSMSFTATGGTADSLNISLEGKDGNDNVITLATTLVIGSTTGSATWTSITYTEPQVLPFVRFKIANATQSTNMRNNAVLELCLYAPRLDGYLPNGNIRW